MPSSTDHTWQRRGVARARDRGWGRCASATAWHTDDMICRQVTACHKDEMIPRRLDPSNMRQRHGLPHGRDDPRRSATRCRPCHSPGSRFAALRLGMPARDASSAGRTDEMRARCRYANAGTAQALHAPVPGGGLRCTMRSTTTPMASWLGRRRCVRRQPLSPHWFFFVIRVRHGHKTAPQRLLRSAIRRRQSPSIRAGPRVWRASHWKRLIPRSQFRPATLLPRPRRMTRASHFSLAALI